MRTWLLLLLPTYALAIVACGGDDSPAATTCEGSVTREAVLSVSADDIDREIGRLGLAADQLDEATGDLITDPTAATVEIARAALYSARLALADLAPYVLVVDEAQQLLPPLAAFPVDTTQVRAHLRVGTFDRGSAPDFDRGFPAVEYLLYAGSAQEVAREIRQQDARAALILAYVADVSERVDEAIDDWAAERDAFLAADGTAAGSGFSRLVNSLSKHYEDTRRDRLGIPFGVTLGFPSPQALEARYSGHSLALLHRNVEASARAFAGAAGIGAGVGLDDYLEGLGDGEPTELAADIAARYSEALIALDAVPADLPAAFENDRGAVQTAYNAISRQVVNLKTDLPSVTCVSITYVDNPSDSD